MSPARVSMPVALFASQVPAVLGAVGVAYLARVHDPAPTTLTLAGAGLVFVAVLAAASVHWLLRRRLAPLIGDAERLARGEAPLPRAPGPDDAFGALEAAFREVAEHLRARDESLRETAQRQQLDTKIHRAVSMADTEADVVEVAGRALARVVPTLPAEILLTDSRGLQLHLAAVSATGLSPGCPVESPSGCAALRRGQTLRFAHSDDLDACPRLRDRPEGACSAVCMPVNVMGRAIGVVHVTAPVAEPPSDEAVNALESVSTHVGARLAMLDSLETFQAQAATDPLTGLLNRRSFEESATRILRQSAEVSVVVCDLDRFKLLNDELGHEAGDRALKLFAQTVKATLRPGDILGRIGGEEFGVVLPSCNQVDAVGVLGRCRDAVAQVSEAQGPRRVTASWGLSCSTRDGQTIAELLRVADAAMYEAKRAGRDRVSVAGEPLHPMLASPMPPSPLPANDDRAPLSTPGTRLATA